MYNRYLCDLIHKDRAKPSWIVSHQLGLDEAPDAYNHFDSREDGWTKVILHPASGQRRVKRRTASERELEPTQQAAYAR